MWLDDPHYVAERDGYSYMHEGKKGKGVWPLKDQQLTLDMKKNCDLEYQKRGLDFMKRSVAADKPFFLYFNHSLMHFPMIPRDEFKGASTNGDWGDCLLMLDHDFGVLVDELDKLGVADNTIVVMCGDNGAEDHLAGRGTGGFFDGSYFSSAEGGIRTPCLIRWPGHIKPGTETNEMVHVTDMFTTLLGFAGCKPPTDRLIDGVDQGAFLLGKKETSNRESCMVWLKDELHAVKWKDFKINFKRQQHFHDPELPLGFARITHLQEDPEGTGGREPAIRALVGDAARATNRKGIRGQHQERTAHSARSSARLRAENRSVFLDSWEYAPGADWRHPEGPDSTFNGRDDHPVVHVTYEDACAYADWAGKSLPIESEWEFVARGGPRRRDLRVGRSVCSEERAMVNTWQGRFPLGEPSRTMDTRAPLRSRLAPQMAYGLYDMISNVWEWTTSSFTSRRAENKKSCCIPSGSGGHIARLVVKGGSHLRAPNYCLRYRPTVRQGEVVDTSACRIGFRCVACVSEVEQW